MHPANPTGTIIWTHYSDVIMSTAVSQITGVSICLRNRLFRRGSNKTSKIRITGLCKGNLPVTGEFPTQRASSAENVSIWWCHHQNKTMHNKIACISPGRYSWDFMIGPHHYRDIIMGVMTSQITLVPRLVAQSFVQAVERKYQNRWIPLTKGQ